MQFNNRLRFYYSTAAVAAAAINWLRWFILRWGTWRWNIIKWNRNFPGNIPNSVTANLPFASFVDGMVARFIRLLSLDEMLLCFKLIIALSFDGDLDLFSELDWRFDAPFLQHLLQLQLHPHPLDFSSRFNDFDERRGTSRLFECEPFLRSPLWWRLAW